MDRTRRRPLVRAQVTPGRGAALRRRCSGVAATALLGLAVNWPSALLADGAILFYVFVYTLGLSAVRRRTSSSAARPAASRC